MVTLLRRLGMERALGPDRCRPFDGAAENDMKIYLLMLLIGTILTAVRFTSAPKRGSETLPQ